MEGQADQILLAGAASYLRKLGDVASSEMLDLNEISIVPAGGGMSVAYMVYLARGRDAEKPAVIVLLDSDSEGNQAKQDMTTKKGKHAGSSAILPAQFILQLGEIKVDENHDSDASQPQNGIHFQVLEDLVPISLAVRATKVFLREVYRVDEAMADKISQTAVIEKASQMQEDATNAGKPNKAPHFLALQQLVSSVDESRQMNIGKVAFARNVIDLLPILREEDTTNGNGKETGLHQFETNMRALFTKLHLMQRNAEREIKDSRMYQKIDEKIRIFESDFGFGSQPLRDDGARLLVDIESDLMGDDQEATVIRQEIANMKRNHKLTEDLTERIRDVEEFKNGLSRLRNAKQIANKDVPETIARKNTHRMLPSETSSYEGELKPIVNELVDEQARTVIQTEVQQLQPATTENQAADALT